MFSQINRSFANLFLKQSYQTISSLSERVLDLIETIKQAEINWFLVQYPNQFKRMTGIEFYSNYFLNDEDSCYNFPSSDSLMSYQSLLFDTSQPKIDTPPQTKQSNKIKGLYCPKTNTFFVLEDVKADKTGQHEFLDMLEDCDFNGFKQPEITVEMEDLQ